MSLLQVKQLSKTFPAISTLGWQQFYAVKNVSFELTAGKTIAIIGRNGSGKSTLVKMIAGIIQPTSGQILFNERPLNFGDSRYRSKHIRMLFQDPNSAFNPRQNVGQILDAPLRITTNLSEEQRNEKIFNVLKLIGLYPDHCNVKINALSASQKQRIALARALILEPQIIIADDAIDGLDASIKIRLTNLMLKLQEQLGIAYIYVGHHLGFVKHVADEVIVMEDGKVVEQGITKQLFTSPQSDITKRLVESHFGRLLDESSWEDTLL